MRWIQINDNHLLTIDVFYNGLLGFLCTSYYYNNTARSNITENPSLNDLQTLSGREVFIYSNFKQFNVGASLLLSDVLWTEIIFHFYRP